MKKLFLITILILAIFIIGCEGEYTAEPEYPQGKLYLDLDNRYIGGKMAASSFIKDVECLYFQDFDAIIDDIDFHMTFNFETGEIDGRLSGSAEGNKGHSLGDFEGRINGVIDGYRFSGTVPLTITYHQEGCQVSHPDPKNADEYWEGVFKSKPTSQTVQVEGTLTGDFFIDDTPVKLTGEDEVFSGWIEISIDELPADWPYDKAPYFYVGCPNCEFPFTR